MSRKSIEHFYKAGTGVTVEGVNRKKAFKSKLISLDERIDGSSILSSVHLGVREIQLKRVIGTYFTSRGNMFHGDFIPNTKGKSEFSDKWISLCDAQLKEGIRDPIKVYEYLNFYYVQEGNKRVSVLKYLDAVSVTAEVTRLIPPYDPSNEEIVLYYAFLEFFAKTDYEDIWFSRPENFDKTMELMKLYSEHTDCRDYLRTFYSHFRRLYKKLENKYAESMDVTTGDVFLAYCTLFGEEAIQSSLVKKRLAEVLQQSVAEMVVEIKDADDDSFKKGYSLPIRRRMKVGFAFPETHGQYGWHKDHYIGMTNLEEHFGNQISLSAIENILEDTHGYTKLYEAVRQQHCEVVFLTDESLADLGRKCAVDFPKTTFLQCTGSAPSYLLPTYYGKTYQTNYLLGVYTALKTEARLFGFVSVGRSHHAFRSFKAFEEGIRSIRNSARVISAFNETDLPENVDVVAYYRDVEHTRVEEGTVYTYVKRMDEGGYMAYTYWRWPMFYQRIVARLLDGSFRRLREANKDASNMLFFNWGMDTGVIGINTPEPMGDKGRGHVYDTIKKAIETGQMSLDWIDFSTYDSWVICGGT